MIHLYCGMGKGKTTAACGLCVRAAGSGMRVLFAQFFKDGTSSEIRALSGLGGVEIALPSAYYGRYKTMSDEQRAQIQDSYNALLREIIRRSGGFDMIVLDEAVSAYGYRMIDGGTLREFLQSEGKRREIVLTGREPAPELIGLCDYITEMRKVRHPFDRGIAARKGIEY
ncbi:MAG: cob(I)yrinic acid a,c-diamide adenosyltransferase [Eubacteriales bacterium]